MAASVIKQRTIEKFIMSEFVQGNLNTKEQVSCMLILIQKKLGMSVEQATLWETQLVLTLKYTIMTTKNIIKEVSYKGHTITMFEDGFHQEFAIIDNDESKLYDSIADAKRVIRGEQPYYEIN